MPFDTSGCSRYLDKRLSLPAIRKPPRVRAGDVVGVIAPSGAVDETRLRAGVEVLERWGFRVVLGEGVLAREHYLAGGDELRRADLARMLGDSGVRAVFCARGGYGSQRLLPGIDFGALAGAPKPIVGYSDVTALLAATVARGVVAVHGPMVADDMARGLPPRSERQLLSLLSDPSYRWEVEVPVAVRAGRATGPLLGGCLSVIAATLGTRWAPDTDGAILFLEDVHERPFRLDRLLTHLRQAGKLDRLAGLVFGAMTACPSVDGIGPLDVIRACCADLPYPVGFGLAAGHHPAGSNEENLALPLGIPVTLDTERGVLAAVESAVV
jgi:muramoyltetrapeptide carboxypeptidase